MFVDVHISKFGKIFDIFDNNNIIQIKDFYALKTLGKTLIVCIRNKMGTFTHLNKKNNPKMVNVSDKKITKRTAIAKATMFLGKKIVSHFTNKELITKKGPVFQTAIVAGIQAVKKTSELIPMCHPLLINGVNIDINIIDSANIEVFCKVTIEGKTGVEMEALTGANITCLTIYDMCKSISQEMVIKEVKLMEKTGGKSDIKN